MKAIKFENVSYTYHEKQGVESFHLSNIWLNVNEGDFCTIIGSNGSGKTTLLRLFSGFLRADSGNISIFEKNIYDYKRNELAKKIAFVSQINSIAFPYTVFEIASMGRTPHFYGNQFENENDLKIIDKYLEMLGLKKIKNKNIMHISGGELQRTFICRALVQQPKILLMDEPVSHLDIKHQLHSYKLLNNIREENKLTLIIVSHDLNMTMKFSNNVILMKEGRMLSQNTPEKLITSENIKEIFGVKSEFLFDKNKNKYLIYTE